jgi:hypothetical protein
MLQTIEKNQAPAYFYNDHQLTVEYSFSEHTPPNQWITSNKLWLDILFMHPEHHEAITIRVSKPTLILCQPREVIEAVVHREIRQFLQQPQVKEYGSGFYTAEMAYNN